MKVAILVATLNPYDAVSIDAFLQQSFFRQRGYEVRLYSESWGTLKNIYNIDHVGGFIHSKSDVILYHSSTSWKKGSEIILKTSARVILKYHNITPARFFEDINVGYADKCRQGREELKAIVQSQSILHFLADSDFNKEELLGMGAKSADVIAPFMQTQSLLDCEADLDYLSSLSATGRKNILMVGRIAPNKNHDLLLKSFDILLHKYSLDVQLLIAGGSDSNMPLWNKKIKSLIDELDLNAHVVFADVVDTSILKAMYLASDLFTMFSEHEGFCIPLVEAQSLGVPILALSRGAVAQTAGRGALLWDQNDPEVLATSMKKILVDESLQNHLVVEGKKNYIGRFTQSGLEKELDVILKKIGVL